MPFISETEERKQKQSAVFDDGSLTAGFSETFDAAVGFAIDEGLSTSRMLNNEMYERRRTAAKEIFDSGVSVGEYMDEKGAVDYNAMARKYDTIKPDWELFKEKRTLLAERRNYYNDVMRRSDSLTANLLGSMTGFMLDPINVTTMAIGTPFAVAKGATVLGRALYGAGGAATINVVTETLIQPLVLDYKLDIDSPYGMEDAITNIAMAAGGGFVLGGMTGGISGWLRKIRGEADDIKISPDTDAAELKVAVEQVDSMIDNLKNNKFNVKTAKADALNEVKMEIKEAIVDIPEAIMANVAKTKKKLIIDFKTATNAEQAQITKRLENIEGIIKRREANKQKLIELERIEKGDIPDRVAAKIEERTHMKQVDSEADYLRAVEEERTTLNRAPDEIDQIEMKIITDNDLEGVYRAMDDPKVVVDEKLVSAKKIVQNYDDDIASLEKMKECMLG